MAALPRVLKRPLVGACGVLVLLAALEGGARLLERGAPPGAGGEFFGSFRSLLVELGGFEDADRLLEPDPELFWKLRRGVHGLPWHPPLWRDNRSNALGWRDPERGYAAPAGALRVLCLGDSCTYGMGVRMADSYPQRLEALLAESYHDRVVEVWNGGLPGWSSDQGRTLLFREGARVRPAIVTAAFGFNDSRHWDLAHHKARGHGRCVTDREARARLSGWSARLHPGLSRFALYRALGRLLERGEPEREAAAEGGVRVPDGDFRDNLRAIAEEARRLGAKPLFLVWPSRWQLEKQPDRELDPPTSWQTATREVGRELDVPVLDLLERFAGQGGLFLDSVHMNEVGCRRVAEELGRLLYARRLLLELPQPRPR